MSAYLKTTFLSDEPILSTAHVAEMLAVMTKVLRERQSSGEVFTEDSRLETLGIGQLDLQKLKTLEATEVSSQTRTTTEAVSESRISKHVSRIKSLFNKKDLTERESIRPSGTSLSPWSER